VAQGIGGDIKGETLAPELVGQHVAGVAGIGADLEERGHRADEIAMGLDYGGAAYVFVEIGGDGAFRFAERGEVVELDLGLLDGERLGVGWQGQTSILPRAKIFPPGMSRMARGLRLPDESAR
jgi:hypothetical protein